MKSLKHYYIVLRRRIIRSILQDKKIAYFLSKHVLKVYLALFYENWIGKRLNYREPQDLNQALIKLSWLNNHNPTMRVLIPLCVDKYTVREYISSKGYSDTLNELYGVYDSIDDIDFSNLPNQFVMKMNNASGRNYICMDRSRCDWDKVKLKFSEWLKDTDFGWQTGEWQYSLIKPKIVVERFLKDLGDVSLIDYKAQVFNGKVVDFFVCYNRNNSIDDMMQSVCYDVYTVDWERTEDIQSCWHQNQQLISPPKQLQRMIRMAEDCCKEFTYCRFDMYEINGKIIFGEMTFTPHGNVMNYYTDDYLVKMKNQLIL